MSIRDSNPHFRPLHSNDLMTFESLPALAQAAFIPGDLLQKIIFFAGAMLLRKTAKDYLTLASVRITSGFNKLQREHKIPRPLASAALMAGGSLAAYAIYSLSGYSLLSGIIFSVHGIFMRDVAYAPRSPAACGIVSFRSLIENLVFDQNKMNFIMDQDTTDLIDSRAEKVASAALLVTSIGLTILCGNPIIAGTVAHPLAAIVKGVALHVLTESTIHSPQM